MKKIRNIYEKICDFENLYQAYLEARKFTRLTKWVDTGNFLYMSLRKGLLWHCPLKTVWFNGPSTGN